MFIEPSDQLVELFWGEQAAGFLGKAFRLAFDGHKRVLLDVFAFDHPVEEDTEKEDAVVEGSGGNGQIPVIHKVDGIGFGEGTDIGRFIETVLKQPFFEYFDVGGVASDRVVTAVFRLDGKESVKCLEHKGISLGSYSFSERVPTHLEFDAEVGHNLAADAFPFRQRRDAVQLDADPSHLACRWVNARI